jgi:hypothetical protein
MAPAAPALTQAPLVAPVAVPHTRPLWQSLLDAHVPPAAAFVPHAPQMEFVPILQYPFGPTHCWSVPHTVPAVSVPAMSHADGWTLDSRSLQLAELYACAQASTSDAVAPLPVALMIWGQSFATRMAHADALPYVTVTRNGAHELSLLHRLVVRSEQAWDADTLLVLLVLPEQARTVTAAIAAVTQDNRMFISTPSVWTL